MWKQLHPFILQNLPMHKKFSNRCHHETEKTHSCPTGLVAMHINHAVTSVCHVRFKVLTAASKKFRVLWDVAPWSQLQHDYMALHPRRLYTSVCYVLAHCFKTKYRLRKTFSCQQTVTHPPGVLRWCLKRSLAASLMAFSGVISTILTAEPEHHTHTHTHKF
jgi:hypothetical protein